MPRRKRRLASRIRNYVRSLIAFLFSNVGVIVLVVAYTIAGAFMFQKIEGAGEIERGNNMSRERDSTAQYLWQNVTLTLNLFNETALKESISKELKSYQGKVVKAVRRGWDGGRSSRQWSFPSAFLYSLTVITTIGYGHLSPRTSWGKIMTVLYALLGMPLFLLYLSNVGELLASWFKCIYALVCLCRGCPGFSRRRVLHIRTQYETSEAESIERPREWREEYIDSDVTPDYRIPPYPPPDPRRGYMRSISMPQPHTPRMRPEIRGWSEPVRRDSPALSDFSYVTFDAQTITVPISVCVFFMVGIAKVQFKAEVFWLELVLNGLGTEPFLYSSLRNTMVREAGSRIAYIMFGSMIFGLWEKWDKLDGAYFCFISLSSIGFGDFVPGERVYTPRIETSFIVCSLYLMLGMALVAMCFNLMQEQVIHYYAGLNRALRRICRCKR